jgi:F-type H+-transporting ATPase subunit delta
MTSATIVNRYANALADVVMARNSEIAPADALAQLRSFDASTGSVHELQAVLASPAVSKDRKRNVIRTIATALGLSRTVVNFLLVLSDHGRWSALHEVIAAFDAVLDNQLGFEKAQVTSAYELSDRQRETLTQQLARIAGRKVRLSLSVDPALIGGVTARVGSTVYDGSVRGHLAKMSQDLASNRY